MDDINYASAPLSRALKKDSRIITGHTNLYEGLFDHAGIKNNTRIDLGTHQHIQSTLELHGY